MSTATLTMVLLAGVASSAVAGESTPQYLSADHMLDHDLKVGKEVHIYYNVATGEKIVSLDRDEIRGAADGESQPVWVTGGDGIVGFAGLVTYWDGFFPEIPNLNSTAVPVFSVLIPQLPGNDPFVPSGFVSLYQLDIDLASDLVSSSVFELGDTDSDLNGADQHNAGFGKPIAMGGPDADSDGRPDGDANGNMLADCGVTLFFSQPGTIDTDNADSDSDSTTGIDGVGTPMAITATMFGVPDPGMPVYDSGADDWDWKPLGAGAVEHEDLLIAFPNDPMNTDILTFMFGGGFGFSCGDPNDMDPMDDAPHASMVQLNLGPGDGFPCFNRSCYPDLDCSGSVDFADVSVFLTLFAEGNLHLDLDNSGLLDFGDVSWFVALWSVGCP